MLTNKKIILGICGSIAAFKSIDLVRLLKQQGADVRVVLTQSSQKFVTTYTLQTLTENPVVTDLFDETNELTMGHIELAKWADIILIAPATADTIAKLCHGFADNILTALWLASAAKKMLAPAMNQQMWRAQVTQNNIGQLKTRDVDIIGPEDGLQACGDIGPGRLISVEAIVLAINNYFLKSNTSFLSSDIQSKNVLSGYKVMITAGPTQEALDPVRYLSNHSSGKMGYALAQSAVEAGAKVILISGPVTIPTRHLRDHCNVSIIDIKTALDMYKAVQDNLATIDLFIGCAAVADYRPEIVEIDKIKKSTEQLSLNLIKNPDIIKEVAQSKNSPFTVGFAAETSDLLLHAEKKLQAKNIDIIIANQVGFTETGKAIGFGSDQNKLTLIWRDKEKKLQTQFMDTADKTILSRQLIKHIGNLYAEKINNSQGR